METSYIDNATVVSSIVEIPVDEKSVKRNSFFNILQYCKSFLKESRTFPLIIHFIYSLISIFLRNTNLINGVSNDGSILARVLLSGTVNHGLDSFFIGLFIFILIIYIINLSQISHKKIYYSIMTLIFLIIFYNSQLYKYILYSQIYLSLLMSLIYSLISINITRDKVLHYILIVCSLILPIIFFRQFDANVTTTIVEMIKLGTFNLGDFSNIIKGNISPLIFLSLLIIKFKNYYIYGAIEDKKIGKGLISLIGMTISFGYFIPNLVSGTRDESFFGVLVLAWIPFLILYLIDIYYDVFKYKNTYKFLSNITIIIPSLLYGLFLISSKSDMWGMQYYFIPPFQYICLFIILIIIIKDYSFKRNTYTNN